MGEAAPLRAFVAIELPEPVINALRDLETRLLERANALGVGDAVRWVAPEGIHLTLQFLGSVPVAQVPAIETALRLALADQAPFRLRLDGVGVFPRPQAPRVIWAGVAGAVVELGEVQRRVVEALAPLGYPAEARAFTPHLTLGRMRERVQTSQRSAIASLVASAPSVAPVAWDVREVSLMRSELGRGGAHYHRVAAVPVGAS